MKKLNDEIINEKLHEIDDLCKIKKELQKEIEDLREKESFSKAKSQSVFRRHQLFRRVPIGWLDSVFCTQRTKILPYITSTLSTYDIKCDVENLTLWKDNPTIEDVQYYAVLCMAAVQKQSGVVLFVRDPFREVHTQPLEKIKMTTARSWIGHILVVKVKVRQDQETSHKIEVMSIKKLNFVEKGIVEKNGVIKKIESPFKEILDIRNKVIGLDECKKEVRRLWEPMRKKGWYVFSHKNEEDFYTYFVKPPIQCALMTKSDVIEALWEENINPFPEDYRIYRQLEKGDDSIYPITEQKDFTSMVNSVRCMCTKVEKREL